MHYSDVTRYSSKAAFRVLLRAVWEQAPAVCFDLNEISISVQKLGELTEQWWSGC